MLPSVPPTSAPTKSFYSCQVFAGDVFLGVPETTGACGPMLNELTTAIMSCESASTNMYELRLFFGVCGEGRGGGHYTCLDPIYIHMPSHMRRVSNCTFSARAIGC